MLSKVSTRKTYCVPLINQKHVHVLIYWVWLIYKEHGRTKKWNVCLYNLIGNKDTLDTIPKSKGINTRDELLKFHSKYYSSNIMSLAVLGKGELRHPTSVSTLPRKKKIDQHMHRNIVGDMFLFYLDMEEKVKKHTKIEIIMHQYSYP